MAGMANYDYDVDAANLQRRMQVADAMMQGALAPMGPTETVGGYAVPQSPLTALAKVAQAYMAGSQQHNVLDQQKQLASRYRGDLQSGVQQLMEGLNAQPGQAVPEHQGNNPSAYTPATTMTPEDANAARRNAILNAVGSNVPALQSMGMSFLNKYASDYMTTKDILNLGDKYDPESVVRYQQTGDPRMLKPKTEMHAVGDRLVPTQGPNALPPVFDARPKFSPVETVGHSATGSDIIGQKNVDTGEVKFGPGGTQVMINNTPQKAADAFATATAQSRAAALNKSFETAQTLPQQLQGVKEAQQLLQSGMITGQGADVQLAMTKLAQKLGIPGADDPKIANTEEFRSKLANSVLEKIKILRPASDKDVEYAKQASGADLGLSAQGLSRLLDSAEATIYNTYFQHEHLVDAAQGGTGAIPEDLAMFHVPLNINADATRLTYKNGRWGVVEPAQSATAPKPVAPGQTPPGGIMTWDEYRRRATGGK